MIEQLDINNTQVDIIVRLFHIMIIILFIVLFVTGNTNDGANLLHILSGYLLTSIILTRLVWSVIDDNNANWKAYIHSIKSTINYVSLVLKRAKTSLGFQLHNPAGSLMILIITTTLILLLITGLLLQSLFEFDGILFFVAKYFNDSQAFLIKDIHLLLSYFMLLFITMHIMGVLYSSKIYKVNMPLMMINGKINIIRKRRKT